MNKVLDLPFDQYGKHMQAYNMINALRKPGEKFSILDVGGYMGNTKLVQKNDSVTILDIFDVEEEGYIKGDATNMQLGDNSYDFVVNFDVLEHITPNDRGKFLDEITRVARIGVVVAAPTNTPTNELAEKLLNDDFKKLYQVSHPWLKEHIENVIPDMEKVDKYLNKIGLKTIVTANNDTDLWVQMLGIAFISNKIPQLQSKVKELNSFYNATTVSLDASLVHGEFSYRKIIMAVKKDDDYKKLNEWLIKNYSDINPVTKITLENKILSTYAELLDELNATAVKNSRHINTLKKEIETLTSYKDQLAALQSSLSWGVTKPLRAIRRVATRLAGGVK